MLITQYMILQKEVKSNSKQPSCKKCVQPQKGHCEKDVKSKLAANLAVMVGWFIVGTSKIVGAHHEENPP